MGCGSSKPSTKENATISPVPTTNISNKSASMKDLSPLEVARKVHGSVRWNKDPNEVNELLSEPEQIDAIDPQNGNSPIHIAAQNGHVDIVKLLIERKCNINLQNLKGNTALHMAIGYDYYECAMVLLANGADGSIVNVAGFPAIRGLEGDKSLAGNAVTSANTFKEFQDALALIKTSHPRGMAKDLYVKVGLRLKKAYPEEWKSSNIQELFTTILQNWEAVSSEETGASTDKEN